MSAPESPFAHFPLASRLLTLAAGGWISLAAWGATPSALVNAGFEDTVIDSSVHRWNVVSLPGWRSDPSASEVALLSVNGFNLAGWAQASILTDLTWDSPYTPWLPQPLEGHVSIALSTSYPADALITDPQWGWSQYAGSRTDESLFLGRAGISQDVGLPADISELTCNYADLSDPGFGDGSLVLRFNNLFLGYTLKPTLGPNGPTTLLRADLTPVAGQYGELRISIEGRGFFIVDNIIVVPEASTLAGGFSLVLATVLGIAGRNRRVAKAGLTRGTVPSARRTIPDRPSSRNE